MQVPAGTVEPGEDIEHALEREIREESGLVGLRVERKLAVYEYNNPETGNLHIRHVFHLVAPDNLSSSWSCLETSGGTVPDEQGYLFDYYWHDLAEPVELAGHQGDYLDELRAFLKVSL